MEHDELIVACDLGSTEFRVLVAAPSPDGGLAVLGAGSAEAAGFRDGDFVDVGSGSRAIAKAVRAAEASANVDIAGFCYGISGSHLRSLWARGQHKIGPNRRAVDARDVDAVLEKATSIAIPFDHAILASNPVSYTVDGIPGVVDPLDRPGSLLEVDAYLVTGSSSVQHNLEHTIEKSGYHAASWHIDALATAAALLTPQERQEGVLLIDIGGQQTQWVIHRSGRIAGSGVVPWGGVHMTNDLAHGLRVSAAEAEAIKRQRGLALRSLADDVDPEILFEETEPDESPGLIAAILEPRLEEIVSLVKRDMGPDFQQAQLHRGVVVTGGGSRCAGTEQLIEEVLSLPAQRRLSPLGLSGGKPLPEGQWATAVGLAYWALGGGQDAGPGGEPGEPPHKPKGWLGGLFRRR
ncbi:MAG: cell division protein FtsA [bacterium]|nr:cell division protein FtsA [bacterium]